MADTQPPRVPDGPADRWVRNTYDRIGAHFAETRPDPWDEVERFLDARTGEVGLDVGVGNGRHSELLARNVDTVIGIDLSRRVLAVARARADDRGFPLQLCLANAVALPLAAGTVDLAVYVATLHHLRPRERRIASLDELARVLAQNGLAVVSAWSVRSDRFDRVRGFDTTVDWTLPDGETVPRFYHIYDPDEFRADIESSRLTLRRAYESRGNCYAEVGGT